MSSKFQAIIIRCNLNSNPECEVLNQCATLPLREGKGGVAASTDTLAPRCRSVRCGRAPGDVATPRVLNRKILFIQLVCR